MSHLFGILNLGHWDLFEIWFLVLGIYMVLVKHAIYVNSDNYVFELQSPVNRIPDPFSCPQDLASGGSNDLTALE